MDQSPVTSSKVISKSSGTQPLPCLSLHLSYLTCPSYLCASVPLCFPLPPHPFSHIAPATESTYTITQVCVLVLKRPRYLEYE